WLFSALPCPTALLEPETENQELSSSDRADSTVNSSPGMKHAIDTLYGGQRKNLSQVRQARIVRKTAGAGMRVATAKTAKRRCFPALSGPPLSGNRRSRFTNSLTGGAGNDTLDGGMGTGAFDWLVGGTGNDTYILNENANDSITENANEGTDTVVSSFTYTLGLNLENLTLAGTSAINGTGNSLDNVLTGNTAANSLSGAAGNDTYVFGAGGGTDTVSDSGGTLEKVLFNASVVKTAVAFFQSGNDLQFGYVGTSDQGTVQNQNISGNTVERFELSDGQFMTDADINTLIQQMAAYAANNSIAFTSLNDVKTSPELMNLIASSWNPA
ncbi:MAG TPA: calcium-binding protein, partial [Candidatus Obscuribacterales bacterium]